MERDLVKRTYPLWKLCIALLALLALLAAGQSFIRLPGGHINAHATSASPSGDPIYMIYQDITGDVPAVGYVGQIELTSLSFGVRRGIGVVGPDREAAAPAVSEITITKLLDKSSPKLFEASLIGEGKNVTINFVAPRGGGLSTYFQIILSNVLISSFSMSSGGDRPTESLTLNFTKIELKYPGTPDDLGVVPHVGWDLVLARTF